MLYAKTKTSSEGASSLKKYVQIFQDLESKILSQSYPPGDYLPTEFTLSQTYKASRDTIRKALKLLTDAGLIQKQHGRGSQITNRQQIDFPVSHLTSYQELVNMMGIVSQTQVISLEKLILNDKLANQTGFQKGQLVWRVKRLRIVDGKPAVLDVDYLLKTIVFSLTKKIAQTSIYNYLENELELDISYAQKEIVIDHASDTDKRYLKLGNETHIVSVNSKVYLADGRQFQYTDSRHKLDKFKFVDFAKRKPNRD